MCGMGLTMLEVREGKLAGEMYGRQSLQANCVQNRSHYAYVERQNESYHDADIVLFLSLCTSCISWLRSLSENFESLSQ
jgi:hypothetical protein